MRNLLLPVDWLALSMCICLAANGCLLVWLTMALRRVRLMRDRTTVLDLLLTHLIHDAWIGAARRASWWAWASSMGTIRVEILRRMPEWQQEEDD